MAIFSHRIKQRQASKIHRLPFEWTTKSFSDILSDASSERLHQLQQPSFKSLVFKISTDQFNNDRGWATVDRQTIETLLYLTVVKDRGDSLTLTSFSLPKPLKRGNGPGHGERALGEKMTVQMDPSPLPLGYFCQRFLIFWPKNKNWKLIPIFNFQCLDFGRKQKN